MGNTKEIEVGPDPVEVILKPAEITTSELPPYPIDAPSCIVEIENDGDITAYRLRRPAVNAETGLDEFAVYAQMVEREGKGAADHWLFDQLAVEVQPPLAPFLLPHEPLEPQWRALTAEKKERVPDLHKRRAIYGRYLCNTKLLSEKCDVSYDGGDWCMQLSIGPSGAPVGVLEIMVNEWSNEQRDEYHRAGNQLAARLPVVMSIFDSIFKYCEGGTVDDRPFAPERRSEFLQWIETPFKLTLFDALADIWNAPPKVSIRFGQ